MVGKSHLAFGAITAAALSTFVISKTGSVSMQAASIPLVLIGSILPDIDNPQSTMGNKFPIISRILNKIFGHRFFVHSVLFLVLIYACMRFFAETTMLIICILLGILLFKSIKLPLLLKIILGPPLALTGTMFLTKNTYLFTTCICFGFLGHSFLDLFTTDGSGILFPILPKISLRNVKTGEPGKLNLGELFFCCTVALAFSGIIYFLKDTKIMEILCNYLTQ